jgi:putative N6-adenine-specific DNA methylase
VEGKSIRSKLFSVPDCQGIVKKAIVEKLKKTYKRSWFNETGAKYTIECGLLKDIATLTIDTTGPVFTEEAIENLQGRNP